MHALNRLAQRLFDSSIKQSSRRRTSQRPVLPASIEVLDSRAMLSAAAGLQLVITSQPPATVAAGTPFSVTVEVQNAQGQVQTDFSGIVSVNEYYYGAITGTLNVAAVNGVATFSNIALTQAVVDDFLVFSSVGAVENSVNSALIQVTSGLPSKFLVTSPTVLLDGSTFNLSVVALDEFGNTAKSFQGNLTVAFGNNPTGATLGGTLTTAATDGVAKFTGLKVNKPGEGYTLLVSSPGVTAGVTQPFKVVDQLVITKQPPLEVGMGDVFDVVVKVTDADGAVIPSYNGTVTVSASTLYKGLAGTLSVKAVNGVATFASLRMMDATSAVALHFTGTGLVGGEVTSVTMKVNAAPASKLFANPIGSVQTDTPFSTKVFVRDQLGNTVTSFQGPVTIELQSSVPGAKLSGVLTVNAVNGVATFSNLSINKAGTGYKVLATASRLESSTTPAFAVLIKPNHAPVGTSTSVTVLEDNTYVFKVSDFPFSDPNDTPSNALSGVLIGALPSKGTLKNNGVPVALGATISVADISAGKLQYTPPANARGNPYASLMFRVKDDGGTANGGIDTDVSWRSLMISVTSVNDAPVGVGNTVTLLEDKTYTFKPSDFPFSDPNDGFPNSLLAVVVGTLPSAGTVKNNGVPVAAGATVSVADIRAGKLQFTPLSNKNGSPYAFLTFRVKDDGGTASGGVDTDQTWRTLRINVTPVNDAPTGASKTLTVLEDKPYAFKQSDFPFADTLDGPPNSMLGVVIGSLPKGTLKNNGVAVASGTLISIADIRAGKLQYTPLGNQNGMAYTSLTFRVKDDGGTENGGVDTDVSWRTLTINVTPVNDPPVGIAKTVTTDLLGRYQFKLTDFRFSDYFDVPSNGLSAVLISTLPTDGYLLNGGVKVVAGQSISAQDIAAEKLEYVPSISTFIAQGTSFTFKVKDNGGTAHGGLATDLTNRLMTISLC